MQPETDNHRCCTCAQLAFGQMSGYLTWAIVAMRNSLVFHDLDKITTLFMHISPALVGW